MAGQILDESWKLENADLLQQLAMLWWMHKGDDGKQMFETLTAARVGYNIWQRVTGQQELDLYRTQCTLAIADYVKKHPNASEKDLQTFIAKEIQIFAQKVEAM